MNVQRKMKDLLKPWEGEEDEEHVLMTWLKEMVVRMARQGEIFSEKKRNIVKRWNM